MGFARRGFTPASTEQGLAGTMGGRGSLGTQGRSGAGTAPAAPPHLQLHLAQEHECDGLEANPESLLPLFLDGECCMFFRERGQPLLQGQWLAGERGHRVPGACAGCCGPGEESPFCLGTTLHGTETAHEFGSKCGKNKPWEPSHVFVSPRKSSTVSGDTP